MKRIASLGTLEGLEQKKIFQNFTCTLPLIIIGSFTKDIFLVNFKIVDLGFIEDENHEFRII